MHLEGLSFGALILVLSIALAACGGPAPGVEQGVSGERDGGELSVYVVNYPLQYFAQRIGGDLVKAVFPVPRDVDPAFWSPDAVEIAAYQQADLVLLNGAGYAKWVAQTSLPPSKLVDTSAAFRDRYLTIESAVTHTHGPEGEHDHGEVAFTTWLDLRLAVEQARAVASAFEKALPDERATIRDGFEALERDLLGQDAALREVVARIEVPLVGSHPVYQYLAQGYGLEIASVHFEPDEYPADAAWRDLDGLLAERPARWMLWEGAPMVRTARSLEDRGVHSLVFDPCGNAPSSGDFLSVQRSNLENLERARP